MRAGGMSITAPIGKRPLTFHPIAAIFPLMSNVRLAELAADIRANGLLEPIQILDDQIIDGRNRYRACDIAGVQPTFKQVAADINPWALVWSLNGQRRDLTADQRYIIWQECSVNDTAWQAERQRIADEANRKRAEAAREQHAVSKPWAGEAKPVDGAATICSATILEPAAKPLKAAEKKAEAAHVDAGTVARIDTLKKSRPDLHQKVRDGDLSSSRAYTQAKREEKIARLNDIAAQEVKAIQGVYDVLVIDPPWQMKKIEREVRQNQTAFDYPTMDEAALSGLILPAADDCHVWCWTTHKHLPMALRLLDAWGLKYVCTFVWHKPGGFQPVGLPQYNCEFAIYARKGAPTFIDLKAFNVCFSAPRGAHSEKPQEFYDVIARVTAGRRLDMFSRRKIDGFDAWGNEAAT